jgi:glycosyltransferase involved in cell wall biosynthesis
MLKISVIIPAYNAQNTIIKCLDSVITQSYNIYEIIVIDDGSTDNTANIIEDISKQNELKNIHLHRQLNSGPSSARNYGIHVAKGDWIAFLDADDSWLINKIEIQANFIIRNNAVFCSTAYPKPIFDSSITTKVITFRDLCLRNYFTTSSVLVNKVIVAETLFDINQKYSEDYKVWLMIAYQHKCHYINQVLSTAVTNKRVFGDSGLSADLVRMELGELNNFLTIYKLHFISFFELIKYSSFSLIKFFRRCLSSIYEKIRHFKYL